MNMFQSIRGYKIRNVLTIKFTSTSKKTIKLVLSIQIILSSNKIQQQLQTPKPTTTNNFISYTLCVLAIQMLIFSLDNDNK